MRELNDLVIQGKLVPIETSEALVVDKHLDPKRRFVRPWTMHFLRNISTAYFAVFHQPIMVDSAVRPMDVQKKLRRRNPNAAPIEGEAASSHMAGPTVDLARGGMTPRQVRWMEHYLLVLYGYGLVEVEEERHQLCFHILVRKRYDSNWVETVPSVIDTETL
jgi:hypothetical protein